MKKYLLKHLLISLILSYFSYILCNEKTIAKENKSQGDIFYEQAKKYNKEYNYNKSLEYYQKAIEEFKKINNKYGISSSFSYIGVVYTYLGEYNKALEYYNKALKISEQLNDKSSITTSLNNIAFIYDNLGEYNRSLEYHNKSLKISEKLNNKSYIATSLNNIGVVYTYLGEYNKALEYYNKAFKISEQLNDKSSIATSLNNIGHIYGNLGDYNQALDYYNKSLMITVELNEKSGIATSLNNIGLIYSDLGNYNEALEYYNKSLKIFEELNQQLSIMNSYFNIGLLYEGQNKLKEAKQYYLKSIQYFEKVRANIGKNSDNKTIFLEKNFNIFQHLIDVLIKLEEYQEAYYYSEKSKARTLTEIFAERKIDFRQGADSNLLNKESEINNRISANRKDFNEEQSKPKPDKQKINNLIQVYENLNQELDKLILELKTKSPKYASLKYSESINLKQTQDLIDNNTSVLEYFISDKKTYLFVINKTEFKFFPINISSEELNEKIKELHTNIKTKDNSISKQEEIVKQSNNIYKLILEPAKYMLKENILIIPDGIISYIPFSSLITKTDKDSKYPIKTSDFLIEKYNIYYNYSMTFQRDLIKQKTNIKDQSILAMGDPQYQGLNDEDMNDNDFKLVTRKGEIRNGITLSRLINSGLEVKSITKDISNSKSYTKKDANEDKLKSEAKSYSIIHLSTHGLINEDKPLESAIALAPYKKEDGILYAYEAFSISLNSDMVVLSACETGLGKITKGEGIIGLSRAFFYAGTNTMLVSLWSVDDKATTEWMSKFYDNLKSGNNKSQSVRKTQLDLIKQSRESNSDLIQPFFWSPFIIIGIHN